MKRSAIKRTKSLGQYLAAKQEKTKPCPAKPRARVKQEWITIYPDGREVLNLDTAAGKREYQKRLIQMAVDQDFVCCLLGHISECSGLPLTVSTISFDHEDGRGMGGAKRDDRIEKDGKPYNGAAHLICNNAKGSRYIDYNKRGEA